MLGHKNNCNIYNTITDREAVIWAKIVAESENKEETVSDIQLIDHALTLMQQRALLTKKRGLKGDLMKLINNHNFPK